MEEFMMIFRTTKGSQPQKSKEEMKLAVQKWQDWMGSIAAQGKFVGTNALGSQGKTINFEGLVSDGPYAEVKEIVGGYIIVKATSFEEAVSLADGCPTLTNGGTVEIRDIMVFN